MLLNRQSSVVDSTLRELLMRNKEERAKAPSETVLAILFFHINGMDEGLSSLKKLYENNNNVRVRICPDQQVIDNCNLTELARLAGNDDWISLSNLEVEKDEVNHFYIPVLPFSTVTDLLNLNDARSSIRILLWAMMNGKKISAFSAGADPYHTIWQEAGMNKGTAYLKHEMKKNLQKLRGYGIELLDNIGEVQKHFKTASQKKNYRVISAEKMNKYVDAGLRTVELESGTIITPLARDIARKYQIKIE